LSKISTKKSSKKFSGWFFKGSPSLNHFIFKNQCRKRSNPTYNDSELEWWISWSTQNRLQIAIQSRSMSDPTFSDIDFKNKMALVWSSDYELPLILPQMQIHPHPDFVAPFHSPQILTRDFFNLSSWTKRFGPVLGQGPTKLRKSRTKSDPVVLGSLLELKVLGQREF